MPFPVEIVTHKFTLDYTGVRFVVGRLVAHGTVDVHEIHHDLDTAIEAAEEYREENPGDVFFVLDTETHEYAFY